MTEVFQRSKFAALSVRVATQLFGSVGVSLMILPRRLELEFVVPNRFDQNPPAFPLVSASRSKNVSKACGE